jgi:hypothetical protein
MHRDDAAIERHRLMHFRRCKTAICFLSLGVLSSTDRETGDYENNNP